MVSSIDSTYNSPISNQTSIYPTQAENNQTPSITFLFGNEEDTTSTDLLNSDEDVVTSIFNSDGESTTESTDYINSNYSNSELPPIDFSLFNVSTDIEIGENNLFSGMYKYVLKDMYRSIVRSLSKSGISINTPNQDTKTSNSLSLIC